ncbi:thiamine phosphate synthase [Mameliella sediminis]|uniref:thiamine phosphate synthase n=1 Tax=Mameliella sediminis TaxID=2836866 RepID=UPI001C44E469|nr:thiamine phosphate synthase [Mameliella sediminis]MBY6114401.1 thiamine phosphate synthase [Antarctobacter heliothermus]MBY6143974.1 thiamine phosphate synthase [Mameliella alba]MBV7393118.1 thiamine phosphate synthase [Mameliella sediminis]MBY6163410.1 thiamine phosphate synthase [Mameliella alba]MBY6171673.1 thiamine phosphate synthase [Mameliella alba]
MTTQDPDTPQIYLVTPPEFDLGSFPELLGRVIGEVDTACLRLSLATRDEDRLMRAADAVREVAHRADVALVIDTHVVLADRLGLDGVHLLDGARSVRSARKTLGPDAIVGAYCRQSRHDGMSAGESGADYVSFGPVSGELGDGETAETELFAWWTEMIEVPVVAEGGLTPELVRTLAPVTDFFAIGEEIWSQEDPLATLKALRAAMAG